MFGTVLSACIQGIESVPVHVEADASDGLPVFSMVGYLTGQVKEAQERVRTALKNSGICLNPKRVTVNLSPTDLKKSGSGFDLPIAAAVLAAYGYLPAEAMQGVMIVGELSLNGEVKPVTGILSIAMLAKKIGVRQLIVPKQNELEGAVIDKIHVIGVGSLRETLEHLNGIVTMNPVHVDQKKLFEEEKNGSIPDFCDINGQAPVRRAAEVAVAGMHNFLMIGPPGSGKSMIAKRIPGILPKMTLEEGLDVTRVYSVAGMLNSKSPLVKTRPFRSPHHTITASALTGGGYFPRPGEISLAHHGVLFLDEMAEFHRETLEILRQPIEEHSIQINRLGGNCIFPADFMLVGAMNPCPCGFYPDRNRCGCTDWEVKRYLSRLSFPLLDRIDVAVEVPLLTCQELLTSAENESSVSIRKRVDKAHRAQERRYEGTGYRFNSNLDTSGVKKYCTLGKKEKEFMERIFDKLMLSARACHRILKVSRTIADLEGAEQILVSHISEAVLYKSVDKKFWQEEL